MYHMYLKHWGTSVVHYATNKRLNKRLKTACTHMYTVRPKRSHFSVRIFTQRCCIYTIRYDVENPMTCDQRFTSGGTDSFVIYTFIVCGIKEIQFLNDKCVYKFIVRINRIV